MKTFYDKNLRPIHEGDVLKVFHFIGPRNKKYYMYKIVMLIDNQLYGVAATEIGLKSIKDCKKYPLTCNVDKNGIIEEAEIVGGHKDDYYLVRKKFKNGK